jgi:hypothetical protein
MKFDVARGYGRCAPPGRAEFGRRTLAAATSLLKECNNFALTHPAEVFWSFDLALQKA